MSLRRSETTEAISYAIDYTKIDTLPSVVRNDKKSIATQSPGEGENYFLLLFYNSRLKPAVVFPPVTVTLKITPDAFILKIGENKKTKNPYI
jgi:hypothetical protein